ncbi:MAG: hypothetical protein M3321_01570 [Actinomycetota bacterium]|nr:hypothetical protein [Actinomycetota bacterium]
MIEGELRRPPDPHILDRLVRGDLLDGVAAPDVEVELLERPEPGTIAVVGGLPACDVCRLAGRPERSARYDTAYRRADRLDAPWAFMCGDCYLVHSDLVLGVGRGQYLISRDEVPENVLTAFRAAKTYWRDRGVAG